MLLRRAYFALHYECHLKEAMLITEINVQLALFRDLLIHFGQPHDCPELRERVRRLRRACVEATKQTSQLVLPNSKKSSSEGCTEQSQLVLLYFMSQLLLRELAKCHRLVQLVPMDMTSYYENRAGPSNFGNVISQILLCKQITPDFNQEELCSIAKDTQEITRIVNDIQEYLPQHESLNHLGMISTYFTAPIRSEAEALAHIKQL
ncbi:hypothetical protein O3G_MSEX007620 [Manduca sexta]|uniref:Uncharacterized protein n=1 Tax=Manduca sexta TaxID=7130 RepID=A0A921Z6Q0_MANSE|nr:hypothetical protein O3G_MSEX007620 [Manduca sexta]